MRKIFCIQALLPALLLASLAPLVTWAGNASVSATSANASGIGSIKKNAVVSTCNFSLTLSSSIGTYPIPPATVIAQIDSAAFSPGSAVCKLWTAQNLPWLIRADGIPSAGRVEVTLLNVTIHEPIGFYPGHCQGDLPAIYDAGSNTLQVKPFSIPGSPVPGMCISDGFFLNVTPAGFITSTP